MQIKERKALPEVVIHIVHEGGCGGRPALIVVPQDYIESKT
jgi:hypothetical protein